MPNTRRLRRADLAVAIVGLSATLLLAACGPAQGGVAGSAVADDPACPASPASSCPAQPLAGLALTIVRASGDAVAGSPPSSASGTTVAQPTTDSTGSFSVRLDPGRYYVYGPGIYGLAAPRPVFFDVSPGSTTSVEVRYAPSTP
jgi:hypothetical protein